MLNAAVMWVAQTAGALVRDAEVEKSASLPFSDIYGFPGCICSYFHFLSRPHAPWLQGDDPPRQGPGLPPDVPAADEPLIPGPSL